MKTIYDTATRNELIRRIRTVSADRQAQWGKMNVYQMIKHCTLWEEMMAGRFGTKRVFLGRIFGRMALQSIMKDDKPMMRNAVTIPELVVREMEGNVEAEKQKWISQLGVYEQFSPGEFMHPFFGRMTKEQVGYLVYKHIDHHLRQFNS